MHDAILDFVLEARGLDLRAYRASMVERRVARRMGACGAGGARDYLELLRADPGEVDRLVSTVAIGVTGFFRDPPVFEALARTLAPALAADLAPGERLRAWVVGASTGEEAYSVAVALAEACGLTGPGAPARGWDFDVIGSDVDPTRLDVARGAAYRAEAVAAVPGAMRARFLEPTARGGSRVRRFVRDRVRFAVHDVIGSQKAPRDAILATFDLVVCRNLLIYLVERAIDCALDRLAGALRPGGGLILGPAESLTPAAMARLEPVDERLRVYRARTPG